ncbi:MAG: ATP-grasp domain-containing protein [Candidatus Omnitrophica bacterium]|nr:ATP-grasp domain-containing protein [Candidatus Omnitrophota bacterium]
MKKRLKVLLVFDTPVPRPRDYAYSDEFQEVDWNTENHVYNALLENGHDVRMLGICKDVSILLEEIKENKPDVIFNLAEVFDSKASLDKNFVGFLEMLGIPYTGSSSKTLFLCNDKALHKKILRFHRIRVPRFHDFYRGHKVWLLKKLRLPLVVKPLADEASRGISQASVVDSEEALINRVKFIHEKMNMDAIAEEYIPGRELYVSLIGNKRIQVLPFREMKFGSSQSDEEPRIATYKAKWDKNYRKKWGLKNVFPGKLANGVQVELEEICKRAYRALNMQCYARFDMRVTQGGRTFIIEANANPNLAKNDEIAQSAEKAGIAFDKLVQRILMLAFKRRD